MPNASRSLWPCRSLATGRCGAQTERDLPSGLEEKQTRHVKRIRNSNLVLLSARQTTDADLSQDMNQKGPITPSDTLGRVERRQDRGPGSGPTIRRVLEAVTTTSILRLNRLLIE